MEKFKLEPGEQVLKKGDLVYSQGEAGVANFFKGKYKVINVTAFVTNRRFVATKQRQYYPWGPLIWLILALMARKIVFSFTLDKLAAIKSAPGKSKGFSLVTADGQEFSLVSSTIFDKRPEWIKSLTGAVGIAAPANHPTESELLVTFKKP